MPPVRHACLCTLRAFAPAVGLVAALLLGGCAGAFYGVVNARSSATDVLARRDIVFDPAHGLALDVYIPAKAVDAPVVVYFYGGSWERGERAWYRWLGRSLAHEGIVTVIPDYRKWPAVVMAGFMRDAANAVAYVHAHAREWQGDPQRMFLMGHSSGGQIAALLATDGEWLGEVGMRPRQLAGVIGLAGAYDFLPLNRDETAMFGSTPGEQAGSQPVNFVDGDEPPMLLLQGTADHEVEPSNAESLARHLRQHEETVMLKLYPGVGHMGVLLAMRSPRSQPSSLADAVRFILTTPSEDHP
ncbi:MAG TPA: alpha/beta hydrolase [Luteibacter sp.]|jgi:acetyl esterase/lipase|nr:alpha/beta hydrolase [Luteibacter sp.]